MVLYGRVYLCLCVWCRCVRRAGMSGSEALCSLLMSMAVVRLYFTLPFLCWRAARSERDAIGTAGAYHLGAIMLDQPQKLQSVVMNQSQVRQRHPIAALLDASTC
jgi:hypothetical protein